MFGHKLDCAAEFPRRMAQKSTPPTTRAMRARPPMIPPTTGPAIDFDKLCDPLVAVSVTLTVVVTTEAVAKEPSVVSGASPLPCH